MTRNLTGAQLLTALGADRYAEVMAKARRVPKVVVPRKGPTKEESLYGGRLLSRQMAGEILAYQFHPPHLPLGTQHWYEPDYAVRTLDMSIEYHEVKPLNRKSKRGRPLCLGDARLKIAWAANAYPMHKFYIVWRAKDGGWNKQEVKL